MRILMLAAAGSVHVVRWANAFADRGHEVHLVSQHNADGSLSAEVEFYRFPHRRGFGYIWNNGRLKALVAELAPDVVNAHYATGYGTLALAVQDIPVVLNVWGSDVFEFPEKSQLHGKWIERNLRHATQIVSTSKVMAARIKKLGGRSLPVTVVPFGVDTELFHPRDPAAGGDIVIGTVKALAHVYGIDLLIRSFALAVKEMEGQPLKLKIVGSGPQEFALRKLTVELGVADKVQFLGAVPHEVVPKILRSFDIFCALSRSESFGVAVIEASASGLPVVVSDVGGLPEVVQNGITGMIVRPSDPYAAMDALTELIRSPEQREELGSAGRRFVEKEFQWENCVDRMLAVLERAVKAGRK